jgi:hypothetical protein
MVNHYRGIPDRYCRAKKYPTKLTTTTYLIEKETSRPDASIEFIYDSSSPITLELRYYKTLQFTERCTEGRKLKTTSLVLKNGQNMIAVARAYCSPKDKFSKRIGIYRAFEKLSADRASLTKPIEQMLQNREAFTNRLLKELKR